MGGEEEVKQMLCGVWDKRVVPLRDKRVVRGGRRWGPLVLERPPRGCGPNLWMYPLDSTILGKVKKAEPTLPYSCHGSFVDRQHSYRQASCQPDSKSAPH